MKKNQVIYRERCEICNPANGIQTSIIEIDGVEHRCVACGGTGWIEWSEPVAKNQIDVLDLIETAMTHGLQFAGLSVA